MINIKNLKFRYNTGDFRLLIPELMISKAEKTAVIGPSGSGKTTLLNLIAGILLPQEGMVKVDALTVNKLNDSQRRNLRIQKTGFIFQDFELLDYLTVLDNILHPYRITSTLTLDIDVRKRAVQLAEDMGIVDKLKRHPGDLSQGEKQRTAICRSLLCSPKIVLADEATGNLDPANKTKILDLLFKNVEENGVTLLAVTHDHELLSRFDRVIDFQDFYKPDLHKQVLL
jgi:putative ABC transport system ATP-binding protein